MSFLHRVAGLSFRDRVRSSDILERLLVEPLFLRIERRQLRRFRDLVWTPPGHLPGEETPGQTKDPLERLYLSADLGTEELVEVARERSVCLSLPRLLPPRPRPG